MEKEARIKWTEVHSVKIMTFDKQHERLFEILNDFYEEVNAGVGNEELLKVIDLFLEYATYHFRFEENIMKLHKFPAYKFHKKQHDLFLNKVRDFKIRYEGGRLLLTLEITQYIKDWIERHMDETDRIYSDFLLERGVR